ncbi:MAG: hypothetical protein IJV04_02620, partial [Lachnospiraceae bacterium]|nr:hypothetical protein [Lachnospiraceae bacterium]
MKIFFSDIRSVACHFFALAIVGGVLILPALYAWINIYANGDPYKNTSRIPVAVSSRDEGITLSNGRHINKA